MKKRTIFCWIVLLLFGGLDALDWTKTRGFVHGYGDRKLLSSLNDDTIENDDVAWDHHRTDVDEAFLEGTDSEDVVARQGRLLTAYEDPGYSDLVFESVSVGRGHTCGVTFDGSGYCWGDNDEGQLGNGSSDSYSTVPVEIAGGRYQWKSVSAGGWHTCGITTDGLGYCWGANTYGRLGDGSEIDSSYPVEIANEKYQWSEISAGDFHTCSVTVDGSGYCWGSNYYGEIGDGNIDSFSSLPVGIGGQIGQWTSLSAGGSHTCGITMDGLGYCWGYNNDGQLGVGSEIDSSYPVEIDGGKYRWYQISAGYYHTCGITLDGSGYCWGENLDGRLGSLIRPQSSGIPVEIHGGKYQWRLLTASSFHTCGITTYGLGFCWGRNQHVQLGIGTETDNNMPTKTKGGKYQWITISSGYYHTCGIHIKHTLYCWGNWDFKDIDPQHARYSSRQTHQSPQGETGAFIAPQPAEIENPIFIAPQPAEFKKPSKFEFRAFIAPQPAEFENPIFIAPQPAEFENPSFIAPQPAPVAPNDSGGTSTNVRLIAGIVGGVVGAWIIATAGVFIYKKWNRTQPPAPSTISNTRLHGFPGEEESVSVATGPITRPVFDSYVMPTTFSYTNRETNIVSDGRIETDPHQASHTPRNSDQRVSDPSAGPTQSSPNSSVDLIEAGDLTLGECIGQGSFGRVFKASWKRTDVVFKVLGGMHGVMPFSESDIETLGNDLHKEASLMAKLRHPNIVQFLGVCLSPPGLVTEYCTRGSLTALLHEAKNTPPTLGELTWQRRLNLLADAARGVLYLHTNSPSPILHRDLKSPNILVSHSWTAKVGDFGLSRVFEEYHSRCTSTRGLANPRWLAPEVLEGQPFTKAADVFAFGVVMWEVLTCEVPWGSTNEWAIVNRITNGQRLNVPPANGIPGGSPPDRLVSSYVSLMKQCWVQDPLARPDFERIVDTLLELQSSL